MKKQTFIIILVLFSLSCKRPVQFPENQKSTAPSSAPESLRNINKYLVVRQQEIIASYVERMGWNMQRTSTGLWFMIYEKGWGPVANKEQVITLDYSISLIDGTLCDSSGPDNPKSFKIGHGGVEPGLEEGALMLHEGDKARFIMTPHLAHGNFGDRQKIPAGEILIYEVRVISIR